MIRACAIVYASYGFSEFREIRKIAAQMWFSLLADKVRLIERIRDCREVPGSYAQRLSTCFGSVIGRPYVDVRSVIVVRHARQVSDACSWGRALS